jgi:outer membrane protein assembly factor BamD
VREQRLLMIRAATVALLLVLMAPASAWARVWPRVPSPFSAEILPDGAADAEAERNMRIGHYYIGRRDYTGAINRFKLVVTQYPSSPKVDEALARLTEAYLALAVPSEAQTAAAVLAREFPTSRWSALAQEAVRSAGLYPLENPRSWIGQAFKPQATDKAP